MGPGMEAGIEARSEAPRVATLGESLRRIGERFDADGALGVVLIDAPGLSSIERNHGGSARVRTLENLAVLVNELVGDRLGIDDLVLSGETGRDELVVMLFRDPGEVRFYRHELPALARRIAVELERRGQRVAHPYTRSFPPMAVGTGVALRNPTVRVELQVRRALEESRAEADLIARIASRKRRRALLEVVLEGQIRSVYEPIVEVKSRTVFGYEALARGPEGSELHSPARLFQLAEEQDLVFQLDCLCRQAGLRGARDLPGGARLFLNVRPTTIHDPNFRAEALERTLARCGLRPSEVVFEISEQESIENFEIFREVRDYYRKLGFQIALDDMGAGYASLEAVMELSPDFVKVDRAFVAGIDEDPARQELLRALTAVASRIGAQLIGEGLDTIEELETLGQLGIRFGQGWLFGKPHPLRSDL
jgi:EAL domain-containing protein (putative c-di-GMP-specific phosphodiesterase class I)